MLGSKAAQVAARALWTTIHGAGLYRKPVPFWLSRLQAAW